MGEIKLKPLGAATVTYREGFEFLLDSPDFAKGLNHVKALKPVTVPLHIPHANQHHSLSLRRTRRNHFAFLTRAEQAGVNVEKAVANVEDPETKRFYLVTIIPETQSITGFLESNAPIERKYNVLKKIALQLAKLNQAGLRHGDIMSCNVSVGKGDEVILTNPELDQEVVEHLHSDFDQLREMLLGLERELGYEPAQLWERVRKENYFKNVKA